MKILNQLAPAELAKLQQKLKDLGFYQAVVDGDLGPITRDALKRAKAHNYAGFSDLMMRRMQIHLSNWGLYHGKIDGDPGPRTNAAVTMAIADYSEQPGAPVGPAPSDGGESRLLGIIQGQKIIQEADGRVHFMGDADIDADGANGQSGKVAAYRADNKGSEHLANGGMGIRHGKVVGVESWWRHIAFEGPDGNPLVVNGVIPTRTSYKYPGMSRNDPAAFVDSEVVPYAVTPPLIIQRARGVVLGCRVRVTNTKNGRFSEGVVADTGPRTKVGEVSIQMARELGINPSPRVGGTKEFVLRYEFFPDVPAVVDGKKFALQRSNGDHVV